MDDWKIVNLMRVIGAVLGWLLLAWQPGKDMDGINLSLSTIYNMSGGVVSANVVYLIQQRCECCIFFKNQEKSVSHFQTPSCP